jgi:DNA mismatch repair protein MutS
VLLDEIGRGTSTYDGVAIAWAVSEHLHDVTKCRAIFATHYHELVQLSDELVAVRNYNVGVREADGQVLFLHRLQPGGADRSYGIEVGRLAGLPDTVLARARTVLHLLEGEQLVPALAVGRNGARATRGASTPRAAAATAEQQLPLFSAVPDPLVAKLAAIDTNSLTPLQALQLLAELTAEASRSGRRA